MIPDKDVDAQFGKKLVDIFKMRLEMVLIARYHVERVVLVVVGALRQKRTLILFLFSTNINKINSKVEWVTCVPQELSL